ncbi:MAG: oligoendopeptidase F, partial [Lachnospiraceae bacterium]|nr:oligoendopeptidase F [Lachnospiraceae bacterium]
MGNSNLKNRNDIPDKYKWNIDKMYASASLCEEDMKYASELAKDFTKFKNHLGDSYDKLADALEINDKIGLMLERSFAYAHMKLDEDNRNSEYQALLDKSIQTISKVSALMSFVTPELISIPEDKLLEYIKKPRLQVYKHMLTDILRKKAHVLTDKEEEIMAQLGEVLGSSDNLFSMLNDADIKFGAIHDENDKLIELTHGNYVTFLKSYNRKVREEAFDRCYETYGNLINTLSANYANNVKINVITSRIRKYDSPRAAALSGGDIPESVYDNLVAIVNKNLPTLHEYISIRKKLLGYSELKMHDIYVPLVQIKEKKIPFDKACEIAINGLSPLGEEYIREFKNGLKSGWIDIYENQGKTSGAYSFGSYDSAPYILLNYNNRLQDVFTLVHEMGHSMNSLYTRNAQPLVYGDHSIFTAEVASTVNEVLLMKYLLEKEEDMEMRKYILNMYIEGFRTTLFRQTMFAEFEKLSHDYVQKGGSLTADWLNNTYDSLNTKYFGPDLFHDDLIKYEWARIPHFYRSFYVYQYATGYSAANAIADKILTEGEPARNAYIEFLKCGTNDYPV